MPPQQEIEMILARQLASYLVMPIFVVDPAGTLVFYNEPAEPILGRRFDETGAMPLPWPSGGQRTVPFGSVAWITCTATSKPRVCPSWAKRNASWGPSPFFGR